MKTVPSVYTPLMTTIHPSHSTEVAEGTVFKKHTVCLCMYQIPLPYYSISIIHYAYMYIL